MLHDVTDKLCLISCHVEFCYVKYRAGLIDNAKVEDEGADVTNENARLFVESKRNK